ncbi:MAG: hypothetical protein JWL85_552 [Candidatus Saccharibacteria bacterium]|nr:hypothetical protein [Candidatus Saccharibacteria bacterium]
MDMRVFNRKVIRVLLLTSSFVGIIYLAHALATPLTWVMVAFFLALAMEPAVRRIEAILPIKSRGLAALIIILTALGIVVFTIAAIVPPLVSQTQELVHAAPGYIEQLRHADNPIIHYLNQHNTFSQSQGSSISVSQIFGHGSVIWGTVANIASSIAALITILVLTFFMILEGPGIARTFWKYQPAGKRRHRQEIAKLMHQTITGYVSGNLLTSLIAAIATTIMLTILRIPYAIPLGLLVGIIDLIPLVGATIAAILVTLASLVYGGAVKALIVAAFFVVYQQIENHTLQPMVYKHTVNISALLALVASLFGATLGGLVGVLVAIPVAASLQILIKDYLDNHRAVDHT